MTFNTALIILVSLFKLYVIVEVVSSRIKTNKLLKELEELKKKEAKP
jgi:hypothetical protein